MTNIEPDEKLLMICLLYICYAVSSVAAITLNHLISMPDVLKHKDRPKAPPLWHRVELRIYVLFHELYPAKEASSPRPLDCEGRLSHQDFIMALQKIDLEGLAESVEEAHLLFQANQLPLAGLVAGATPHPELEPGPSSDCGDLEIPTTSCRGLLAIPSSQANTLVDSIPFEGLIGTPKQMLTIKKEQTDASLPAIPLPGPLCIEDSCDHVNSEYREDIYPPEIIPSVSISENYRSPFICLPQTGELPGSHVWPSPLSSLSDEDFSSHVGSVKPENISATVSNTTVIQNAASIRTPEHKAGTEVNVKLSEWNATEAVSTSRQQVKIENERRSRRKASLSVAVRRNSTSSTSDLDICDNIPAQNGCSSDSELDHRSERQMYVSRQSSAALASSRDTWAQLSASWMKKSASESCLSPFNEIDSPPGHQCSGNQKSQWNIYGCSADSSVSSNKRDRTCRDAEALEAFGVPFTYEQVVGFTNEEFKEIKNSPCITPDQINVMLEARRRATNRQAAERCRQRKVAVRDEVTDQLAKLRLQRKTLTQRLLQARQRHQETRDSFITEQKRLLAMLRGSTGDELKYSDWRIRLTKKDEVVVMAAGH